MVYESIDDMFIYIYSWLIVGTCWHCSRLCCSLDKSQIPQPSHGNGNGKAMALGHAPWLTAGRVNAVPASTINFYDITCSSYLYIRASHGLPLISTYRLISVAFLVNYRSPFIAASARFFLTLELQAEAAPVVITVSGT